MTYTKYTILSGPNKELSLSLIRTKHDWTIRFKTSKAIRTWSKGKSIKVTPQTESFVFSVQDDELVITIE